MVFYKKFNGDDVYFISDLHWQHKNIVRGVSTWEDKRGCRDFDTLEQMDETIIKSINDTVPENKVLFVVGDILFGNKSKLKYWRDRIKCKELHYLFGNHCDWMRFKPEVLEVFTSAQDYLEIFCRRKNGHYVLCCLFHYPMKVWNESHKGSYALTGHSHGTLPYTETEKGLDLGWEIWKRPISFMEVDEILSKRKFVAVDHHREGTN